MRNQKKVWLVAYDVCQPRRLHSVHRQLRKEGVPAQYSAFTVEADDEQIERLMKRLRLLIDEREDDLRAYHLPASCSVWSLGAQHWPDGICLSATRAARLLMATEPVLPDAPAETDCLAQPSAWVSQDGLANPRPSPSQISETSPVRPTDQPRIRGD